MLKHSNKQVLPPVPELYPLPHANFSPPPRRPWPGPAKHEEFFPRAELKGQRRCPREREAAGGGHTKWRCPSAPRPQPAAGPSGGGPAPGWRRRLPAGGTAAFLPPAGGTGVPAPAAKPLRAALRRRAAAAQPAGGKAAASPPRGSPRRTPLSLKVRGGSGGESGANLSRIPLFAAGAAVSPNPRVCC